MRLLLDSGAPLHIPAPQYAKQMRHNNPWTPALHLALQAVSKRSGEGGREGEDGHHIVSDGVGRGSEWEVLKLLLEAKDMNPTLLNGVDATGQTAVHLAAAITRVLPCAASTTASSVPRDPQEPTQHTEQTMVQASGGLLLLLKARARPDAQAADGRTALHVAARAGNPHALRLLLEYGADRTLRDHEGRTAQQHAEQLELMPQRQQCLDLCSGTTYVEVLHPYEDQLAAALAASAAAAVPPEGGNPKSKRSCNGYNSQAGCHRPKERACCFGHFCSRCGVGHAHSAFDTSLCPLLKDKQRSRK